MDQTKGKSRWWNKIKDKKNREKEIHNIMIENIVSSGLKIASIHVDVCWDNANRRDAKKKSLLRFADKLKKKINRGTLSYFRLSETFNHFCC